jgi:hypothetical protein
MMVLGMACLWVGLVQAALGDRPEVISICGTLTAESTYSKVFTPVNSVFLNRLLMGQLVPIPSVLHHQRMEHSQLGNGTLLLGKWEGGTGFTMLSILAVGLFTAMCFEQLSLVSSFPQFGQEIIGKLVILWRFSSGLLIIPAIAL